MKILAIRLARLGDVILLLPALGSLKNAFPDSEITLLTGHRCAPIADLCPAIDHVLSVDRVAMRDGPPWRALREMAALIREVRHRKFDLVVDFHSFRETNLLSWLSGAPARIAMMRYKAPYLKFCFNQPPVVEDKNLHVSKMFERVAVAVQGTRGLPPPLRYQNCLGRLAITKAEQPTIAFYVDAPVQERIWPPEGFAEVADHAIEKLGATVLVISSTEGAHLALRVRQASRNPDRIALFSDLSLPRLAGVIGSAHLLVSNDTGPMHLGPATGVETLGLFSVGYPEHFAPIGADDRYLRGNPIEQIKPMDVIRMVEEMWIIAGRGLRR